MYLCIYACDTSSFVALPKTPPFTADKVCCFTQQTRLLCGTADMPVLLATQNHCFASQKGRGKPLHAHDAIVRHATYKTYIPENLRRGQPLLSCDTKP